MLSIWIQKTNEISPFAKTILNSNYFQKKDQAIREEWMFELFKKGVALLNGIKEYSKLYTNT